MKSVAVIGASTDRSKFGNKAVRAYARQGFTVWPVNPKESVVEGLPAFTSIADVPARPQLVSVYLRRRSCSRCFLPSRRKAVTNSGSTPGRNPRKSSRKRSGWG